MPIYIYALVDPRNGEIRYVGKTGKKPAERVGKHIAEARGNNGTHRLHWLRQLLDEGLAPEVEILEEVKGRDDWEARERYWIEHGQKQGWPLTNATAGGDGLIDPSPETRQKLAEAAQGNTYASGERSKAFKERMAEVAKVTRNKLGKPVPEEAKRRISETLRRHFADGGKGPQGERNGQAKLTAEDIRAIREKYAAGGVSYADLGADYDVSRAAIGLIVRRKNWQHI